MIFPRTIIVLLLLVLCAGCQQGVLRVEPVAAPIMDVCDRHDQWMPDDLDDLTRRVYLRDTELIRALVREALDDASD